jgi:hypothetical protein
MPGRYSRASAPQEYPPEGAPFPNFDIRAEYYSSIEATDRKEDSQIAAKFALEPKAAAAQAALERNVRGLQMRWDPLQERPRLLFSYDEPLTIASNDPAETIARRFLRHNRDLYGLGSEVENLKVARNYRSKHNGASHVALQQEYGGLEIFGAEARVTLSRDGRVVVAGSDLVSVPAKNKSDLTPVLSPREALRLAAANVGIELSSSIKPTSRSSGEKNTVTFNSGEQFEFEPTAKLMLFPMSKGNLSLAWQVRFVDKQLGHSYAIFIDDRKGSVLLRHNLTWNLSEQSVSYRVFAGNTPQPNLPFVSSDPPFTDRQLITFNGDPIASPRGWVDLSNPTTMGNNVIAQTDRSNSNTGSTRPTAVNGSFDFPLVLATNGQEPENFGEASVTNLFYWCNRVHDYLYKLGFDEASGNFQADNLGRGGLGNDAIVADAQDGGGLNNANFSTSEDGRPGNRMQMYLWNRTSPKVDGSYDAEVIVHEYVHGLTTRLVGGPQNVITLFGLQSGGMGEGWSDWYAMSILSKAGDNPRARYPFGSYVAHDFERGIRRFAYSTDMQINPLTYADLDPSQSRFIQTDPTEVHRVGEIWCQALWDVRADFIEKHGFERGKEMIEQLVTDGLKLTPPNPSFIDGRDAILLADQINNGGANQCLIWRGFARRGVGFSAFSINGSSSRVKQSFDLPPYCQKAGTLSLDRNGYASGETIKITLGDADLAGSTNTTVTVSSTTTGDNETLVLAENDKVPGQFLGNISVAFATAVPGDNVLQSGLGDNITVTYNDASAGQGGSSQVVSTVRGVKLQTLFDDTIESGPGNFTPDNKWQITNRASHSPVNSWTDSPNGDYEDQTNSSLKLRKVKLTGMIGSRLVFWQKYDFEPGYDFGLVEIKIGTQPWLSLASFTGSQDQFRETVIDLSKFDGKDKVRLRFRLVSDIGKVGDGWYIDDIKIVSGVTN